MKIYTSTFNNDSLPEELVKIQISLTRPVDVKCKSILELAPRYSTIKKYQENDNIENFKIMYNKKTLDKIKVIDIYNKIVEISNYEDCVLLTDDKSGVYSHRHIVAEWLNIAFRLDIREWGE